MSKCISFEAENAEVRAFFGSRPVGYFIEVGANDPQNASQTWHLEQLGWTGLLIEPMQENHEKLLAQRPKSRAVRAACSSPDKRGMGALNIAEHSFLNCLEKNVDDQGVQYSKTESVPIVTLDDVLNEKPPGKIDFISIDVEGTEMDVLRGFDLAKWKPELLVIEDKVNNLEKHRYLSSHGYRLLRRLGINGWYVPVGHPAQSSLGQRLEILRKYYLGMPFRKYRFNQRVRRRLAKKK
ncbi:MAG TPA: FkbM family methyltransferase [Opitutales bacterium]|jgi:FkbM family methyltransferase|nr:FkbM family methyltransferase [Opitutales bacterium]